jgi:type I restriction enzyme S subunit
MSSAVPDGWSEQKLGKVATLIMGQSPSSSTYNVDGVGLPFYQGKADFGSHHPVTRVWCSEPTKIAPEKSVLFSVRAPVGDVNITKDECCIGRGIAAVIGKQVNQSYLYQNLIFVKPKFELLAQGSTFEAVNGGEMKEFEIIVPPLPEQKKIASILTSVDEVIENTESQIAKLQDLKTGMMQELLTKGIGHTEFKDSPVGMIPLGWQIKDLKDVLESLVDCEHKTAPYVDDSEFLVVRTSNVRNGELVYEDMKYTTKTGFGEWTKRSVPSAGDILFTREAPAGESCLVPSGKRVCLGQRMVLLKPDNEVVQSQFLSWYLVSQFARQAIYRLSIGTTVTRINIEDIYKVPCVLPPIEEQKSISDAIGSVVDKIEILSKCLDKLKSEKSGLMQDLLTGNVRVKVEHS